MTQKQEINLLDLKPLQSLQWEMGEDQRITLLVPKFQNRFLVKYLLPRIKKPYFHIKLDEHGSFIWNLCDGETTVGEIADRLSKSYGENFDPEFARIGKFIGQLIQDKFLVC